MFPFLRFAFFLFRRGEENIVEDEAIARRIFVQCELRGRVVDEVLIVFRVVSGIKCERAFADVAVDVFDVVCAGDVAHDGDGFFDAVFAKGRGLAQKAGDDGRVVLREHGGHGIVFCRKFKEGEGVDVGISDLAHFNGGQVDVGVFVFEGVHNEVEVFKGYGAREVEFLTRLWICGIAVVNAIHDVDSARGKGDVKGIGGRAHGKEKSALRHVVVNGLCNRAFEVRDFGKAQFAGEGFKSGLLLSIPEGVPVAAIKFAVLSREVFVMQVQPIEVFEFAAEDFFVPQGGVGDFRIRECECDGVVPGLFVRGGIDRDAGCFFKVHAVHVAGFNVGVDARGLRG